ncbi:MAG: transcription antitermination factor NusB [Candidatus Eiseniibacteriota bacterium]
MARAAESARRRARELAFRVVYQADLTSDSCAETWRTLRDAEHLSDDQSQLVSDVVACLGTRGDDVDRALAEGAEHWSLARLAATDRAVLRLAVAELWARPGTPARVVLDEAIEIAKRFGSAASGAFVNGVLDRVARQLRPGEL